MVTAIQLKRMIKNNEDVSSVDISQITDMNFLFENNKSFNGDISNWDVSNIISMYGMFKNSTFNGDISKWNVSGVKDMSEMFKDSTFNGDISKWNVSSTKFMLGMFNNSSFNSDISNWSIKSLRHAKDICFGNLLPSIFSWDITGLSGFNLSTDVKNKQDFDLIINKMDKLIYFI